MHKLFAVTLVAAALAACSSMSTPRTTGNPAETRNSTDANKSGNPAAVSPGPASGSGSSSGSGSTSK